LTKIKDLDESFTWPKSARHVRRAVALMQGNYGQIKQTDEMPFVVLWFLSIDGK
jgi:hypothetical protein